MLKLQNLHLRPKIPHRLPFHLIALLAFALAFFIYVCISMYLLMISDPSDSFRQPSKPNSLKQVPVNDQHWKIHLHTADVVAAGITGRALCAIATRAGARSTFKGRTRCQGREGQTPWRRSSACDTQVAKRPSNAVHDFFILSLQSDSSLLILASRVATWLFFSQISSFNLPISSSNQASWHLSRAVPPPALECRGSAARAHWTGYSYWWSRQWQWDQRFCPPDRWSQIPAGLADSPSQTLGSSVVICLSFCIICTWISTLLPWRILFLARDLKSCNLCLQSLNLSGKKQGYVQICLFQASEIDQGKIGFFHHQKPRYTVNRSILTSFCNKASAHITWDSG